MVCSGGNVELGERILDLLELDVAALRDVPGAVESASGTSPKSFIISARVLR